MYDLVLCDPPYSVEDAEHYQTTMVKRNKVMKALERVASGTHVVWLDQTLCQYRKINWKLEAEIGVVRSTNHRFRVMVIWSRR
jgi:23S rRNA A2030 N6-methylase RlmJ